MTHFHSLSIIPDQVVRPSTASDLVGELARPPRDKALSVGRTGSLREISSLRAHPSLPAEPRYGTLQGWVGAPIGPLIPRRRPGLRPQSKRHCPGDLPPAAAGRRASALGQEVLLPAPPAGPANPQESKGLEGPAPGRRIPAKTSVPGAASRAGGGGASAGVRPHRGATVRERFSGGGGGRRREPLGVDRGSCRRLPVVRGLSSYPPHFSVALVVG